MRCLLLLPIIAGCVSLNSPAVPETVTIEAGTSVRHEPGEQAVQVNSAVVKAQWRLRK